MRILLLGYNDSVLSGLDRTCPPGSVFVIEEPDLWRERGLAARAAAHPCFEEVRLGRYQQDEHYLEVVRTLPAFDAIGPGMEYAVTAAARTAEMRGLPGAGVRAATILQDKLLLREATTAAGMATPRFREIHRAEDIAEFAQGRACVVKPSGRQAGLGVLLLDGGADVARAWRECSQADEGSQLAGRPMSWRYMVEERVYGPEYSTECLVREGELTFVNVTRKRLPAGRRAVAVGHVVPGAAADDLGPWRQAAKDLVRAVDFRTGILHAEWILARGVPVLIECAGRQPGGRIMDLIDLAYDMNISDRWIRLLAGADGTAVPGRTRAAAVRFITPGTGTVDRITGLAEARKVPGLHRIDLRRGEGDTIGEITSLWDRFGSVIAVADTAEEAECRALQAASMITVHMR